MTTPYDSYPSGNPPQSDLDPEALRRAVGDGHEIKELDSAAHTRGLEALAAVPLGDLVLASQRAEQNRQGVDEAITQMTAPLVALFRHELNGGAHAVKTPKHLGTIAEIPPLDENPRAWHEYIAKHCAVAPWQAKATGRQLFAAGLPNADGTYELVGFGAARKYAGEPQTVWIQVHTGRVVVVHRDDCSAAVTFITGIRGDSSRPPAIQSKSKAKHSQMIAVAYNPEKNSFEGNNPNTGRDIAIGLGTLAELCEEIVPTENDAYLKIALELFSRRPRRLLPEYE